MFLSCVVCVCVHALKRFVPPLVCNVGHSTMRGKPMPWDPYMYERKHPLWFRIEGFPAAPLPATPGEVMEDRSSRNVVGPRKNPLG